MHCVNDKRLDRNSFFAGITIFVGKFSFVLLWPISMIFPHTSWACSTFDFCIFCRTKKNFCRRELLMAHQRSLQINQMTVRPYGLYINKYHLLYDFTIFQKNICKYDQSQLPALSVSLFCLPKARHVQCDEVRYTFLWHLRWHPKSALLSVDGVLWAKGIARPWKLPDTRLRLEVWGFQKNAILNDSWLLNSDC